jgi:response regulator RpfG family c-di-GMP phosphodiesterase
MVATLAATVAASFSLAADEIDEIRHAAQLHDVGKVAIPDAILDKPQRSTRASGRSSAGTP